MLKKTKIFILGQSLPRELDTTPYRKTRLYHWLSDIGIGKEELLEITTFDAVVDSFPGRKAGGRDNMPDKFEIIAHTERLKKRLSESNPVVIIPLGIVAIQMILGDSETTLKETIGKKYKVNALSALPQPIAIIPLPHPSGLNTWVHKEENKPLMQQALRLLREEWFLLQGQK